jgi:PKD repeat protein
VCIGSPVIFENLTIGPAGVPNTYEWAFGDGTGSTQAEPQHVYAQDGTYTVVMTATNIGGSDSVSGTASVDPVPEARFTYTPHWPRPRQTVSFFDASTSEPTSWSWTFGDGASSTLQNPRHAYANSGLYTVSLRATNRCGQSSVYQQTVRVDEVPPTFLFYLPLVVNRQ